MGGGSPGLGWGCVLLRWATQFDEEPFAEAFGKKAPTHTHTHEQPARTERLGFR